MRWKYYASSDEFFIKVFTPLLTRFDEIDHREARVSIQMFGVSQHFEHRLVFLPSERVKRMRCVLCDKSDGADSNQEKEKKDRIFHLAMPPTSS